MTQLIAESDITWMRALEVGRLDAERRAVLGPDATLKLYETAAGEADEPVLTLDDDDHWHVIRGRLENRVEDVLIARLIHDPDRTAEAVMVLVDRLKLENARGLEDLSGLLMSASIVQRPAGGFFGEWVIRGEEVTAGAR